MKTFNIIEGHIRELIKSNEEISQERLLICKKCSIVKLKSLICNNNLYVNPYNNHFSITQKEGYYKGCGCRLKAKTTLINEKCPAGKW